jgi:hypothetical protein
MMMNDHAYIGPPDIHDATIVSLDQSGDCLVVRIRSYEGREFGLRFRGVTGVKSENPEGMMLFALSQCGDHTPYLFSFSNWDEEDAAFLEVTAEGFETIKEEGGHPRHSAEQLVGAEACFRRNRLVRPKEH